MSYLQKKIIITGQNDGDGNIYVTDYKEEDADEALTENYNKVNINGDDNNIEGQVANIRNRFLTNGQAPAPAPALGPPLETVSAPAPETVSAPAPEEITIENFQDMSIPWRADKKYNNEKVLDYITWIKREIGKKGKKKKSNYNANELNNIVVEYNKLVKNGSITQGELDSFFNLTENLENNRRRGGKTKKLRAFRKKTLRNQRNSKKRLGSRKNLR